MRIPLVLDGKVSVTCANHCFSGSSLVGFHPRPVKAPPADWIENLHCTRYWADTPAARCPVCGIENYRQTLNHVVREIGNLPEQPEHESLITLTKDLVATFDGVMRAMARGHAANIEHRLMQHGENEAPQGALSTTRYGLTDTIARWPGTISFQNLPGARKNLLEATCRCTPQHRGAQVDACSTGSDIERWVTDGLSLDAWRDVCRVFQKRHLYQHGLGAADSKYIDQSGDHKFRVGQRVMIGIDELRTSARACSEIANRFFGLFLS
ncbi:hypothetical protein [Agromyces sp. NPDC058126]|uniref:hypothetical protein n=1 Tax=Agromyces sp. NPDC058126 TaxID=3346350 RepID=UPI0036D9C8EF